MIISDNLENLKTVHNDGAIARVKQDDLVPQDREALSLLADNDIYFTSPLPDGVGLSRHWRIVLVDDASGSQYDALLTGIRTGIDLPYPLACVAFTGRNFHGQRQRPWSVFRGNLHLTLYHRPEAPIASTRIGFVVLPALAAIDAISTMARGETGLGIKWVNDIMLGDRKIGGVLTSTQIRGDKAEALVSGIGLNIARKPEARESFLSPEADFLQTCLPDVAFRDIFWSVLVGFEHRYNQLLHNGPEKLIDDYRRHSMVLGREVCVCEEEPLPGGATGQHLVPSFCGVVTAIGDDLGLTIDGRSITTGRITLGKPCRQYGLDCPRKPIVFPAHS